jgi:hypothetical protein
MAGVSKCSKRNEADRLGISQWLAGTVVNQSDDFVKADLEGQSFLESESGGMSPYPGDATPTSESGSRGGLSSSSPLSNTTANPILAALWQSSVANPAMQPNQNLLVEDTARIQTAESPVQRYRSSPTYPPPSGASSPPPYQVNQPGSLTSPTRTGAGWI